MPAEQGKDAERFAAAVEQGRTPGSTDAELQRDLEIVAMLRSRTAEFAPHPDAKARAKQRLMAVLAAEQAGPGTGNRPPSGPPAVPHALSSRAMFARPTVEEQTAPMGRLAGGPVPADANSVTTQMPAVPVVTNELGSEPEAPDGEGGITIVRSGRRGRHTMPNRPARGGGSQRPARPSIRRRAVLVGSAALVMLVALTGGGIFASRNALPGDSLYGVKRAAESAGLALTFDDAAKARRQLELATTRLDEIEKMSAAKPQTAADPALYRSAIEDFDAATGEGSRMLLAINNDGSANALGDLRKWAAEQSARLSSLSAALPSGAGAKDSIQLLDRLLGRAKALQARADCTEITSGAVDDLGPLPAEGACTPRPIDPGAVPGLAGGKTNSGSGKTGQTPGTTQPDSISGSGSPDAGPGTTTPEGEPTTGGNGLLPGIDTPDLGLPDKVGTSADAGTPTSSTAPTGGPGNVSIPLPLPLLPPITLPPLLPGLPGITIG
ncbi:DUF5667 domain-containing protein [Pseudonocardia sp. GCM10023141]|uniref:DUF5667 domain-containing protein n=1 Tax=Pseudonocardia sp. GCM10023141 TaxID=3252653 RepID=UPI00360A6053